MPKLAPRATKPADFPAQILAAAEKNATVRALIERFDRSVAFAQIEIPHAEARAGGLRGPKRRSWYPDSFPRQTTH